MQFFNAGLLVHLTKQLHQIVAVICRKLAIDFPLQAGSSLTASRMAFEDFKHFSLLLADDLILTTNKTSESRAVLLILIPPQKPSPSASATSATWNDMAT